METPIQLDDLINALMDEETLFPPKLLYQFSDLSSANTRVLREAWPNVPLQRRRNLVSDLVDLAESDPMLMFEEMGRIALEDADDQVVESAIDLLFEEEDRRLATAYLDILTDTTRGGQVRAAAANVLGVRLAGLADAHQALIDRIENALLAAHHADPSDLVRRRALESLGFSNHADVPQLIRAAFARQELDWVESALFAMGRSADEQWEQNVLATLTHENAAVRAQAFHAAGELSLQKARQTLVKALKNEVDSDVRHEAIWALSQIGGEGIGEKLEALLEETDDDEEAQLIEEALDTLNFINGDGELEMLAFPSQAGHQHAGVDGEEPGALSEEEEEEEGFLSARSGLDLEEWDRYINDGDSEFDEDDEFDEDSFEEDDFDDGFEDVDGKY